MWRVDIESYTIEDIVPLIVGFEKPDTCDVVYIPEELSDSAKSMLINYKDDNSFCPSTAAREKINKKLRSYFE